MAENISYQKLLNDDLRTEETKERVYSFKKNVLTNNNCAVSVSLAAHKFKSAVTDENKVQQIMEARKTWSMLIEKKVFSINKNFPNKQQLCCQRRL